MAKVTFIEVDADQIMSDLVTKYESLAGRKVQPGQAERLVLNAIAYRLSLVLSQMNEAANQCLVANSSGTALEYLAQLVGVTRLPAAAAECTIRFVLIAGHGSLTIPVGIRVQSVDGQAVFTTVVEKIIDPATNTVDIKARCTKDGSVGNGYNLNEISIILDPQPYLTQAVNIDKTAGGTNDETDDELKDRIKLAPSSFSVAGPTDAYKFFARRAHPAIVDIAVTIGHDELGGVIPGQVDIFPLLLDGQALTDEIGDAITAECNNEKVRPLTDTIVIKSPTQIDYAITIELTLLNSADEGQVTTAVTKNVEAYRDARKNKLGIDVVRSQLVGVSQIAGVYKVHIVDPAADIVVDESSFTNCTGITITVVGRSDE